MLCPSGQTPSGTSCTGKANGGDDIKAINAAINGCGVCVDAHEKVLQEKGVGEETILAAVRIASVIHALAVVMDAVTA